MRCDDTASTGLSPDRLSYFFLFVSRFGDVHESPALDLGSLPFTWWFIRAEGVLRRFVPCGRMKEQWDKGLFTFSSKHFHWYSVRLTTRSYDRSTLYSSRRPNINTRFNNPYYAMYYLRNVIHHFSFLHFLGRLRRTGSSLCSPDGVAILMIYARVWRPRIKESWGAFSRILYIKAIVDLSIRS